MLEHTFYSKNLGEIDEQLSMNGQNDDSFLPASGVWNQTVLLNVQLLTPSTAATRIP